MGLAGLPAPGASKESGLRPEFSPTPEASPLFPLGIALGVLPVPAMGMTGGSSGGPWIYGKDDNVYYGGYVSGVNSNVDDGNKPTETRSPYSATWVGDAFNKYSKF
ncbi:hypothetical protein ACIHCX_35055 [Streptomyces sp. NPDC052043]|uniref:hypothetical protein n=1 Tax=Streptomyces sp. NPDC052043 TaxID=3365684 RepID=UPI0037CF8C9F